MKTKITIEEPGKAPVSVQADVFALSVSSIDGDSIVTSAMMTDPQTLDRESAAEAALTGVLEIASTIASSYSTTRAAALSRFLSKIGKRLAGLRSKDGAIPKSVA